MNKGLLKNILIVLLLTMTVFSIYKYKTVLNENYVLQDDLSLSRQKAAGLETEKQNLLQDIEKRKAFELALKANLRAGRNKIDSLFEENSQITQALDELSCELSVLKTEKIALEEEKEQLSQEKAELMVKLSSIEELQVQIKELKEQKAQAENANAAEGNKGYLTKSGLLTYPAKIRIEVAPASRKE